MIQVFDEMTAPSINGTSLKGYIEGWSYDDMVHVLGKPTFNEPSGDDKTQVEWVCKFNDQSLRSMIGRLMTESSP